MLVEECGGWICSVIVTSAWPRSAEDLGWLGPMTCFEITLCFFLRPKVSADSKAPLLMYACALRGQRHGWFLLVRVGIRIRVNAFAWVSPCSMHCLVRMLPTVAAKATMFSI